MRALGLLCLACLAALVGCGSGHRAVLYQGISSPLGTRTYVVTDAKAVSDARSDRADWLAMVRRSARGEAGKHFASLSRAQFRSRLAAAAARYGFAVKEIRFLDPRQVAPLVVVQTSNYVAFAHAVPAIEHSLDPHVGHSDSAGWSFRAFYLEAIDERGIPFLAIDNVVAPDGVAGGQWARSDALYPFVRV